MEFTKVSEIPSRLNYGKPKHLLELFAKINQLEDGIYCKKFNTSKEAMLFASKLKRYRRYQFIKVCLIKHRVNSIYFKVDQSIEIKDLNLK